MKADYSDRVASVICTIFLVLALPIKSITSIISLLPGHGKRVREDHLDIPLLQGRLSIHKYSLETYQRILNPHAVSEYAVLYCL